MLMSFPVDTRKPKDLGLHNDSVSSMETSNNMTKEELEQGNEPLLQLLQETGVTDGDCRLATTPHVKHCSDIVGTRISVIWKGNVSYLSRNNP